MLDIAIEDDHIVFNILTPLVTKFGLTRIPYRIRPNIDDVSPVLRASAHYHWHLHRHPKNNALQNKVSVEFMRLNQLKGEIGDDVEFFEHGNPVLKADENLNRCGLVDIVVDNKAMYGIKIINNMNMGLYPYLFFFDNSDFSIG
jgi:hypothetical protein